MDAGSLFLKEGSALRCVLSPTGLFWNGPKEAKKPPRGHPLVSPVFYGGPPSSSHFCLRHFLIETRIICPARYAPAVKV